MGLNKQKGLSSLIGDMDRVYSKELGLDEKQVLQIPLELIKENPFQPRKHFDKEALEELAQSIQSYGLIQPVILLRKNDEEFILVAGERRLRACKLLNQKNIKAIVSDESEEKLRELALIENIQRQDLNPIDLANSYKELIDYHKITQDELAKIIHKSRPQITNTLRLLNLSKETQDLIAQGKISQGHAKTLIGLSSKDEKMVVDTIIGQKLNTKETEKIIQNIKKPQKNFKKEEIHFSKELETIKKFLSKLGIDSKVKDANLILKLNDLEKIKKLSNILGSNLLKI